MFVKYNGVLRGLQSESAFLRNQMVQLCCAAAIADEYQRGKLSFKETCKQLNKYTTTLHGINSAVIKLGRAPHQNTPTHQFCFLSASSQCLCLSVCATVWHRKLTQATKVYRGISGMALPTEFWEENAFGVRGGVENAFMSTTLERNVAMG